MLALRVGEMWNVEVGGWIECRTTCRHTVNGTQYFRIDPDQINGTGTAHTLFGIPHRTEKCVSLANCKHRN